MRKINCKEICTFLHPCHVELQNISCKHLLEVLAQPKVCLGTPLSILLKNDVAQLSQLKERILKPKFNSCKNDLIRPAVELSGKVKSLLSQTLCHPEKPKKFSCSQCNKSYATSKTLYGHVRLIHKGDFNYQCQDCGRKFLNRHHYKTHRKLHLNILKYQCAKCGRRFVRKPLLQHHMRTKHSCSYKCPHCTKSYTSRKALRNHVRGLDLKYDCPKCCTSFSSFHTCRRHSKKCK